MAPPGESLFSTEFFYNLNGSCPHYDKYRWGLDRDIGILEERIWPMAMCIPYIFVWLVIRKFCKSYFPMLAGYFGVKGKKKLEKFSYQMWLGTYYTFSTIIGIIGYYDEAWFQFPVGNAATEAFFNKWPFPNTPFMEFAYQYQLGFYLAELFAIFNEPRRSDFVEYVIHHVTTILLVAMSDLDMQTRVGCYIFFIHDIPDIFLCFAKCCHYLKMEILTNTLFVFFVATFFFNRLICLPSVTYGIFCQAGRIGQKFTIFYQVLAILLCVVLQALHVFWFVLIVKMVVRLATGVKGDVRSDEDDDDVVEAVDANKKQKKVEDKKKK